MNSFVLEIITPQKKSFSEEIEMVTVPTLNGTIGVLKGHVSLFTVLTEGEIKIVTKTREYYLAIGGGYMEVMDNKVSVLVSRAAHADELNEAEIEKATKNAKEVLSKAKDKSERDSALAMLQRSHLELQVLKRLHAKPGNTYGKH